MEKTTFLLGGMLVGPLVWIWIKVFVFHEVILLIPLAVYIFVLALVADEIHDRNVTKMDKTVQTEAHRMKDQSVQTEDFSTSESSTSFISESSSNSEMKPDISEVGEDENSEGEIHTMAPALSETEVRSSPEIDLGPPSQPKPEFVPFPSKEHLPGVKVTRKKVIQRYPNLIREDAEATRNDKVDDVHLQYIAEKLEEKKLPLFRRKMGKFLKRFKKK